MRGDIIKDLRYTLMRNYNIAGVGGEPVEAHGCLHPAHHEVHVVGGEGGEEQVRQLGGAHHREPSKRTRFQNKKRLDFDKLFTRKVRKYSPDKFKGLDCKSLHMNLNILFT